MKARFTEEQIIKILKEHEGGKRAADIVREKNITERLISTLSKMEAFWLSTAAYNAGTRRYTYQP